MENTSERNALFISHATPEDNAFVRWLGAKLAALGYEVWADVMRLHGGSDWSKELEDALRKRAAKVLVVCTPTGMDKQGVRNEIEIASNIAAKLGDKEFIIPLRLENYEAHFRIAHIQYVDFKRSWSQGFIELAELLEQFPALRKEPNRSTEAWLEGQRSGASKLINRKERLSSNWLQVTGLPGKVFYCEPPVGFQLEKFQHRSSHTWPVVPFRGGVLTFAEPSADGFLGQDLPAKTIADIETGSFIDHGWAEMGILGYEARRHFADLGNQAFEAFLHKKGLSCSEGGIKRRWWYGDIKTVPLTMIPFDWEHQNGRRQIIGKSDKRGIFWHYAISGQIRTSPVRHVRISSSLIFSDNGMDAMNDHRKAHRLRRSFAKTWRNARWRDMMLAFLSWISADKNELIIPVSSKQFIYLGLPPVSFLSPVTVLHDGDEPSDEDDPDFDESDLDEYPDFHEGNAE